MKKKNLLKCLLKYKSQYTQSSALYEQECREQLATIENTLPGLQSCKYRAYTDFDRLGTQLATALLA